MSFFVCKIQHTLNKTVARKIDLSKSSLSRGFAFIKAPDHVRTELIKSSELDFKLPRLTIEEALAKPKITESSPSDNKTTAIKNY